MIMRPLCLVYHSVKKNFFSKLPEETPINARERWQACAESQPVRKDSRVWKEVL